jgi:hypothetical protein
LDRVLGHAEEKYGQEAIEESKSQSFSWMLGVGEEGQPLVTMLLRFRKNLWSIKKKFRE